MAIRPKSGSLFAAEAFLNEIKGTVAYLRDVTRIDEVGKYGAQRIGTSTNSAASGRLSASMGSRLKKTRFFFKECFHRSSYLNGANCYLEKMVSPSTGLSRVSLESMMQSIPESRRANAIVRLTPELLSSKLTRFVPTSIDESLMKRIFYSDDESGIMPTSPSGTNVFQVVDNRQYLKKRTPVFNTSAMSIKSIFGNTDLDDQILSLQKTGYITRNKNSEEQQKKMSNLVSGEELIETLEAYKKANSRVVRYFSGFRRIRNSFVPTFRYLTKSKLSALASEGRPVLCMMDYIGTSQLREYGNFGSFEVYDKFFIVCDANVGVYSPSSPTELAPLENILSTYDAEILTTDPTISTAEDIQAPGSSMVTNMGTFTPGGSGGGY